VSISVTSGGSLRRLARRATEASLAAAERCDLCSEPVPERHRHLLESGTRQVACVCQACSLLFARPAASIGKYRLIPDRRVYLADLAMTDAEWDSLRVPVGICFVTAGRAYYPGAMGPAESVLDPSTWNALVARYPLLGTIEPDIEAFLVNRARGARDHFIVPIDTCFSLAGLIRRGWRGLSGGNELWTEIGRFFEALRKQSRIQSAEATACPPATT
jgi:hypothetical protein